MRPSAARSPPPPLARRGPVKQTRCRRAAQRNPRAVGEGHRLGHAAEALAHPVEVALEKLAGLFHAALGGNRDDDRALRLAHPQRQAPRRRMTPHLDRRTERLQLEFALDGFLLPSARRHPCPPASPACVLCRSSSRAAASRRDRTAGLANFVATQSAHRPLRNIDGSRVARARQTYNSIRILGIARETEGEHLEILRRLRLAAALRHRRHVLELRDARLVLAHGSCARMNLAMRGAISERKRCAVEDAVVSDSRTFEVTSSSRLQHSHTDRARHGTGRCR